MNYAPEISGTAPYTQQLAEYLSADYEVSVFAGVPHYPGWKVHDGFGAWKDTRREGGVLVERLRHFVPRRPTALKRIVHEVTFAARVIVQRDHRPEVVLAVTPPLFGAIAALLVARRSGAPFGVIVQDIYSTGMQELAKTSGIGRLPAMLVAETERFLLRHATNIVTIEQRIGVTLDKLSPGASSRTTIIRNWSHIRDVLNSRAEQRAQLEWGDRHVLLHAGNMGEKQGLENIVEAARDAERRRLPLLYVLMGDGSQRPSLEKLAKGLESIEFRPPVDENTYTRILNASDILLINERVGVAEMSLPSKLTSYCAAARPIAGAVDPSGVTADTLRSIGAGILVPPGDPQRLNSALMNLLADKGMMEEYCTKARAYGLKNFGATEAMDQYRSWISDLAAAGQYRDRRHEIDAS